MTGFRLSAIPFWLALAAALAWASSCRARGESSGTLRGRLQETPFKIAYECYVGTNWEIYVMNADGTGVTNLTRTPGEHEHYPVVSMDGTRLAFLVDRGEERDAVRSLYVMDIDGQHRQKIADQAREPFWCPDNRTLGYLHQEYSRFNVMDYFTRGLSYHDVLTRSSRPHPNSTNLHHLYNPSCSPDGRWIVATAHAGMGVSHGILALEVDGPRVVDLRIPGCRPCWSPSGREIAWSSSDHDLSIAPIDLRTGVPVMGPTRLRIHDEQLKVIHVDWSPDGRFLCFSRGPNGRGDLAKPGTFAGPDGLVGVYAAGWNLCVVAADRAGVLDLSQASDTDAVMVTTNGLSNKEPAWFKPAARIR